jgi:ribosomal protein L11 methyltransferase
VTAEAGKAGSFVFRTRAELGLEGPEAQILWEHGCRGVVEDGREVLGYFDRISPLPLVGDWQELPDEDYLERYYQELQALVIPPLVIAPTHRTVSLTAGQKPLWIDPGMAFGTGHHETTKLALEALISAAPEGKRVLDVGSGSGILAIAADLLGASEAIGLDIDSETMAVARANAAMNLSRAHFHPRGIEGGDLANLLVANLHAELHVQLASDYARCLPSGGRLLVTGILADRVEMVERALQGAFGCHSWSAAGEWRLLSAIRGG